MNESSRVKFSAKEKTVLQNTRNGVVEKNLSSGTTTNVSRKVREVDYFRVEQKSSAESVVSKRKQQSRPKDSSIESIVADTKAHGTGSQYTGTLLFTAVTVAADRMVSALSLTETEEQKTTQDEILGNPEENLGRATEVGRTIKSLPQKAIIYGGRAAEYVKLMKNPESGIVAPHLEKHSVNTQNLANKIYNSERYRKMQEEKGVDSSPVKSDEPVKKSVDSKLVHNKDRGLIQDAPKNFSEKSVRDSKPKVKSDGKQGAKQIKNTVPNLKFGEKVSDISIPASSGLNPEIKSDGRQTANPVKHIENIKDAVSEAQSELNSVSEEITGEGDLQEGLRSELAKIEKNNLQKKARRKAEDSVKSTVKTGAKAVKKIEDRISETAIKAEAKSEGISVESVKLRHESRQRSKGSLVHSVTGQKADKKLSKESVRKADSSLSHVAKTRSTVAESVKPTRASALSFSKNPSRKAVKGKSFQKNRYRRDYAKAVRGARFGKSALIANTPVKAFNTVKEKLMSFISGKKSYVWILALIGMFVMIFVSGGTIFTSLISGTETAVIETTYPSTDEDILGAEAYFKGLEANLKTQIDNIEWSYPNYDEYTYDLEDIKHNPYVLISYLSAVFGNFKQRDVQDEIYSLFSEQYTLTLTEKTEIEYEEVTDYDDEGDPVLRFEEKEKKILEVKLENKGLPAVTFSRMTQKQKNHYLIYQKCLGNRSYLFGIMTEGGGAPNVNYHPSEEALSDENFRKLITEAEKYLGYPYVWGGASPETSFDCSGYVSWVINHSGLGYNFGRLGSDPLFFNMCTSIPESLVKPGDLIFFQKTYDTDNTSHVGIVVGENMMIHCGGNGVEYANYKSDYWIAHFYAYGRLHSP
ncbi:MAG: NlpC/P60 family protein [Clostridia bacterium]|nr:NlpC/P60 family protein [Clostridia bacterium]